jgi:hypothetical protein
VERYPGQRFQADEGTCCLSHESEGGKTDVVEIWSC